MKAIQIQAPKQVKIIDIPMPQPKEGEALLEILYGGICGSDLGSYRGTFAYFDYPRIPGHEFSARIVKIGANDRGLEEGMVVTCNPYFNCGHCYSCQKGLVNACMDNQTLGCQRDGAFSKYFVMPIERIYDGKGMDPKLLAMVEPFCIGYHGAQRADIKRGDKVLIIGSGTIGLMAAFSARSFGGEIYLADIAEEKRAFVKSLGFENFINSSDKEAFMKEVNAITNGYGFDVTIEAVGLPETFQSAIDCACFGGRVVLIGVGKKNLDFNFTMIQKKELTIRGSRNALKADFLGLIDLVNTGTVPLEKMISAIYPMERASDAFHDCAENIGKWTKVLIDFTE